MSLDDYLGLAVVAFAVMTAGAIVFAFGYLYGRRSAEREAIIDRYYQGRLEFEPPVPRPAEVAWAEDEVYWRMTDDY